MVNRGIRHKWLMWVILSGIVAILAALIVAIAMDVKVSTETSAAILAACGVISVALILSSSRLTAQRGPSTEQPAPAGVIGPDAGTVSNWMFLADTHMNREEFEAAARLYQRAVDAGHAAAMEPLAEALHELGRDREAEHYRRLARESGR